MSSIGILAESPIMGELYTNILRLADHRVEAYERSLLCSDTQWLTRIHTINQKGPTIDLLLIDLWFPYFSGVEVIYQLQCSPLISKLPLVFCTTAPRGSTFQALSLAPHACVVEKPFHPQTLLSTIKRALTLHHILEDEPLDGHGSSGTTPVV